MTDLAPKTAEAYATDWRYFSAWCERRGVRPAQVDERHVADHLNELSSPANGRALSVATIARRYAAIKWNRAALGNPIDPQEPCLAAVVQRLRTLRASSRSSKQALPHDSIAALVSTLDLRKIRHVRDKAILLLGMATGLRPAQLVGLKLSPDGSRTASDHSILILRRGMIEVIHPPRSQPTKPLRIRRSDNQMTCAVAAIESWIVLARLTSGPVFRRIGKGHKVRDEQLLPSHINAIVKRAVKGAGLSQNSGPSSSSAYSGISLRPPGDRKRKGRKIAAGVVS